MTLTITRKRVDVDLICDQDTAERIAALGRDLAQAEKGHVTEGANAKAKAVAQQIDELREQAAGQTIRITLEALPLSQWRQILEANTKTVDGVPRQRIEDIMHDAMRVMIRQTEPETPVDDIADAMLELSDGQISPLWYAVRDLNAKLTDPKDTLENASRILRNS